MIVRQTRDVVRLCIFDCFLKEKLLHIFHVRFEHGVQSIFRRLDEISELATELTLAGWVPDEMAVLDEDLGMLLGDESVCAQGGVDRYVLLHNTNVLWCRLWAALLIESWSRPQSQLDTRRHCLVLYSFLYDKLALISVRLLRSLP